MRVTLTPGRLIPKDPDMRLRLRRETASGTAATPETVTVVQTNTFLDRYLTGTSLADHVPDAGGGAYVSDAPGTLSLATINGDGGLDNTSDSLAEIAGACTMTPPLSDAYTFEWKFEILTKADGGRLYYDLRLYESGSGKIAVQTYLDYETPDAPTLEIFSQNAAGATLFDETVTLPQLAVGVHAVRVALSASGTAVRVDGLLEYANAAVSNIVPNAYRVAAFAPDSTMTGKLTQARVYTQE